MSRQYFEFNEWKEYIKENIEFNNNIIKKLEILYNCNIPIKYLNIIGNCNKYAFCVDYNADIIEFKSNQIDEEKNILINYKLKKGEIIN